MPNSKHSTNKEEKQYIISSSLSEYTDGSKEDGGSVRAYYILPYNKKNNNKKWAFKHTQHSSILRAEIVAIEKAFEEIRGRIVLRNIWGRKSKIKTNQYL